MRKIYTSADQLIGKTPLLELVHIEKSEGLEARVLGKLEYFNPAGSVKDRIAKAMIDDAEAKGALKPGGRVAILTFHSGEDKLVKKALKEGYRAGIYADYAKDVIRPSAQECAQNGRARSTKMRWAIKAE
mgnify:CR=1 FL=1